MKKVLLRFFADTNLGDDMMVFLLLNRHPDWDFYTYGKNTLSLMPFTENKNFHLLDDGYFSTILSRRKFDAYVMVGGSVLNYNCLTGLCYQLKEIMMCALLRLRSVKTMVIGANIAPPERKWYRPAAMLILHIRLRLLSLITVRDCYSHQIIAPIARGKVHCFPDIVFGYPAQPKPPKPQNLKTLGISVLFNRSEVGQDERIYMKIAELANRYLQEDGRRVLLFAFDTGSSNDCHAMLQVYRMIEKKDQADMVMYRGDPDAFIDKIGLCDHFLPIRFHAAVLSLMLGIPFAPIIYANKTINLLNDLHYSGSQLKINDLCNMDAKMFVKEHYSDNSDQFLLSKQQLVELGEASKGHFAQMEELLRDSVG